MEIEISSTAGTMLEQLAAIQGLSPKETLERLIGKEYTATGESEFPDATYVNEPPRPREGRTLTPTTRQLAEEGEEFRAALEDGYV